MRFLIVLVCLMLLVGAVSCDRFSHDFLALPTGDVEIEMLTLLSHTFDNLSYGDVTPIAALYAENYIHNGVNKADRVAWISSFFQEAEDIHFVLSNLSGQYLDEASSVINWRLKIMSGETVLADSMFIGERSALVDSKWVLQGNGVCTGANPKQLVIAEYFTFRTCPNCPPAEAKLHQLEGMYDNFIYLEHHTMMELMVVGNDTYSYYGNNPAPSAVFNGQYLVNGSNATALAAYQNLVEQESTIDAPILYDITDINMMSTTMSAKVSLTPQTPIDLEDVYLNYVVITNDVSYTNIQGEALHNVVRFVGRKPLAGLNLQDVPISIHMSSGFPTNARLVVFAQYRPQNFSNDAKIYGGAVVPIN